MSVKAQSHILITDKFSRNAQPLRDFFDSRFADPHSLDAKRFTWDYWHIPDQYTLLRTPAYHYFPEKLYMKLHHELVYWGRKNLGCWDISPPWLSYYIDGCKQELHSDVPHGPWAFVFSLTNWSSRNFSGGETLILKPEVLSYWKNFGDQKDRELKSFIDRIPAKMNRLTVFDPRFPHGVTEVRGARDPRDSRIVIHGWFTEPKTYIEGYLPAKKCERLLNEAFFKLQEHVSAYPLSTGTLSLQLEVSANGKIRKARFATNTLKDLDGKPANSLSKKILEIYSQLSFPTAKGRTSIVQPLIFH